MFDYLPRIIWAICKKIRASYLPFTKSCTESFIVWPFLDTDGIRTMAAPKFLTFAGIMGWVHGYRGNFVGVALKKKWKVFGKRCEFEFFKPVKVFSRFQVTTRLIGYDGYWLLRIFEFHHKGVLCARAHFQFLIIGPGRTKLQMSEIMSDLGLQDVILPPWPEELKAWLHKSKG